MYTIRLSIKDKKVFDRFITDFQKAFQENKNENTDSLFDFLENIQITETSLSGELNKSIEELELVEEEQ
jgi:hypothetical protein